MAAELRPKLTSPPPPKRRWIKYLVILCVALVTGLSFFFPDIYKHDELKSVVKGKSGFYGVRFDNSKWRETTFEKPSENDLDFWYQDLGIIAFTIVDREIPLDQLKDIVIKRMQSRFGRWGPVSFSTEARTINGKPILYLEIDCFSTGNFPLRFAFYLHSSKAGSVQLGVYTPLSVFKEFALDIRDFLDGLEIYN